MSAIFKNDWGIRVDSQGWVEYNGEDGSHNILFKLSSEDMKELINNIFVPYIKNKIAQHKIENLKNNIKINQDRISEAIKIIKELENGNDRCNKTCNRCNEKENCGCK
jgi:LPS O-antigen subunit length determinant protein (WzzB/FepE family)